LVGAALILPHWGNLTEHPVTRTGAYAFLVVAGILMVILAVLGHPVSGKLLRGDMKSGWRKVAGEGAEAAPESPPGAVKSRAPRPRRPQGGPKRPKRATWPH